VSARDFTPRPYQHLITDHILATPRCAVWAGMGTGKSGATLSALDVLLLLEGGPVLIVAPLRVARTTWPDEVRKWRNFHHMRVSVVTGPLAERERALRVKADIYTTNFESLPWLVEHYGENWPFLIVVVDESTKLKGFRLRQGTQRAKALGRVAHTKIRRLIELTGTPSPNGLNDLWGQVWFLDRGHRLGKTYDAFRQRWFEKSFDGYSISPKDHAQDQIQRALRDLCITIDGKDWFDLREPVVTNLYVDLPAKARALYEDMEKRMFMEIEEHQVEAFGAAARTVKCLQLANGAAYVGEDTREWREIHDAKLQVLEEIVEEAAGMPVLVAYNFKSDLERLRKAFPDGVWLSEDAGLRAAQAGKGRIWFGHPASMGHGVDGLQYHSNILAFFGHNWNLEERLQMIERIGPTRQMQAGQDRPMFIYNIIARDTVDEMVIERVNSKRAVQDILLEAMKTKGYST
jgi:SNF2 family DNA or RNA helicase